MPRGDSLAGLAAAAAATQRLRLGTGVIPLNRRPASGILAAVAEHALPEERLTLGVSTPPAVGALARVREGLAQLRAGSSAELVVGGLGPKMRRLGAEHADGLLLNWLTPAVAAEGAAELRAQGGGRAVLYARTIMAPDARAALEAEAAAYESYPPYAANFERLGIRAINTTIDGTAPGGLDAAVAPFLTAVDELVLRAITPEGTEPQLLGFVDAVDAALA